MRHLKLESQRWTLLVPALVYCLMAAAALPAAAAEEQANTEEQAVGEEHAEHEPLAKRPPYLGSQRTWFFVSMLEGEEDAETLGLEFESYFDLGPYRVKNISYFELADYPRQIPGQPQGNESVEPGIKVETGVNDLLAGFWASRRDKPHSKHHVAWGPAFQFPTASTKSLGSGKWSAGPGVDYEYESGKFFGGFIALNLWSFAGDSDRKSVNFLMVKPFAYYELSEKWQLTYVPYGISVYWDKPSGEDVYLPLGGGFQRQLGKRTDGSLAFFQNVLRPSKGPKYDLRLMFEIVLD